MKACVALLLGIFFSVSISAQTYDLLPHFNKKSIPQKPCPSGSEPNDPTSHHSPMYVTNKTNSVADLVVKTTIFVDDDLVIDGKIFEKGQRNVICGSNGGHSIQVATVLKENVEPGGEVKIEVYDNHGENVEANGVVEFKGCGSCTSNCSSGSSGSSGGSGANGGAQGSRNTSIEKGRANDQLGLTNNSLLMSLPDSYDDSMNISSVKNLRLFNKYNLGEHKLYKSDELFQLKNDYGLTQIDVISADSYTVKQYSIDKVRGYDSEGYYTVAVGSIPNTEIVYSKNSANPQVLAVTEKKNDVVTRITTFAFDHTKNCWVMWQDLDANGTLDRYEYTTKIGLVETEYVYSGNHVLASKIQKTYDENRNLIEEVIDPDGLARTTSYVYIDNQLQRVDYSNGSWEERTYYESGEVNVVTRSSGGFVKYEYDENGRLTKKIESFNGSTYTETEADHKVTTYSYSPVIPEDDGSQEPDAVRVESIVILGNPISKTYFVYLPGEERTIRAVTPTAGVNNANNLVSIRYFETSGEYDGETTKEINEGGLTGTIFERSGDESSSIVTTYTGVFDGSKSTIVSGTRTTVISEDGFELSTTVEDITSSIMISQRTVVDRDDRNREVLVRYLDLTTEEFVYDCCNLDYKVSRDGVRTDYTYDSLYRENTVSTNGVTKEYFYDAAGNIERVDEIGKDGAVRTISRSYYNRAGDLEWSEDAEGNRTRYSSAYSAGNTIETVTFPNNKTRITTRDENYRTLSVTGTGVFHEGPDLDDESIEFDTRLAYHVHVQQYGKSDNWTKSYTDALGRSYKTESDTGAVNEQFYDSVGNIVKSIAATGAQTLFYVELSNKLSIQALDVNRNGSIDYGTDVITRTQSEYISEGGIDYFRTRSWISPDSFASPGAEDNVRKVSTDGLLTVNTSTANGISSTLKSFTEVTPNGIVTTNTNPDGSYTKATVTSGLQQSIVSYDENDVSKSTVNYGYDKYDRLETQTDSRNGTTRYAYDNNDRVTVLTTTDPDGSSPQASQEFKTFYTNMGLRDYVVHPDNSQINFTYTDQGLIESASGSQVYPRSYGYDSKGNLTSLTTTGQAGVSSLTWQYYPNGQLKKKIDARNREVEYSYYASGQIKDKTTSRGVKTWIYDASGRLDRITYSDSTPEVSFGYNNLGRLASVSDAIGDRNFNYNGLGQFTGNSWFSGVLSGLEQSYTYDSNGRQKTSGFTIGGITRTNTYLYNSFGLLENVNDGANDYKYSYLDQSPYTVETLEVKQNGTVQMHSKREFDKLMRTTGFSWATGAKE